MIKEKNIAQDDKDLYDLGRRFEWGIKVKKDLGKAVEHYSAAAEQGNTSAQYHLGHCLLHGKGVSKNEELAVHYFRLAAKSGHLDATTYLTCIALFTGTEENKEEARKQQESSEKLAGKQENKPLSLLDLAILKKASKELDELMRRMSIDKAQKQHDTQSFFPSSNGSSNSFSSSPDSSTLETVYKS